MIENKDRGGSLSRRTFLKLSLLLFGAFIPDSVKAQSRPTPTPEPRGGKGQQVEVVLTSPTDVMTTARNGERLESFVEGVTPPFRLSFTLEDVPALEDGDVRVQLGFVETTEGYPVESITLRFSSLGLELDSENVQPSSRASYIRQSMGGRFRAGTSIEVAITQQAGRRSTDPDIFQLNVFQDGNLLTTAQLTINTPGTRVQHPGPVDISFGAFAEVGRTVRAQFSDISINN